MSELEIEEPDFHDANKIDGKDFRDWFQENVEPTNKLLREGVEVTGQIPNGELKEAEWGSTVYGNDCDTHKALLINIKPIKQKTREEKAIELLEEIVNGADKAKQTLTMVKFIDHYKMKAKKLLESKNE